MSVQAPFLTDTLDEEQVDALHGRILTVDAHIDVRDGFNTAGNDAGLETEGQFDLPKILQGGLKLAVVALYADGVPNTAEGQAIARAQIDGKFDGLSRLVAAHPDKLTFVRNSTEIAHAAKEGKQAILLSYVNAVAFGSDITQIDRFHEKGVRILGLVHIGNNSFAASSRPNVTFGDDPDPTGGLTELGRQAITRLNELGIVPDVTQLSPRGVAEVLALSKTPVLASHSGVRGRVDSPRNLSNAELRAIADKGGVAHIVAFTSYLRDRDGSQKAFQEEVFAPFGLTPGKDNPRAVLSPEDFSRFQAGYRKFSHRRFEFAGLIDWLDAVDYAVRVAGIEHVGLSSDFNNGGGVRGYAHVGEAKNVTRELLRRGYSEDQIEKLWGGNFLRVLTENEQRQGAK